MSSTPAASSTWSSASSSVVPRGTLSAPLPTRDHTVAEQSKNCRYSTNHQVVIDADTRLVVTSSGGAVNAVAEAPKVA
ncbi:hypothetical protein DXZ75_28450 [Streptomyces sp. AcE210]|nr:hypothetical protein DXZ75_28450 [Streptomyces sp. AcE210]